MRKLLPLSVSLSTASILFASVLAILFLPGCSVQQRPAPNPLADDSYDREVIGPTWHVAYSGFATVEIDKDGVVHVYGVAQRGARGGTYLPNVKLSGKARFEIHSCYSVKVDGGADVSAHSCNVLKVTADSTVRAHNCELVKAAEGAHVETHGNTRLETVAAPASK